MAATQDNVTEEAIGAPLAMWELEIQNIELEKAEGGLGFSILDYQVGKKKNANVVRLYFLDLSVLCSNVFFTNI